MPLEVEVTVLARPRRGGEVVTLTRRRGALSLHPPEVWVSSLRADLHTAAGAIVAFPVIGAVLIEVAAGMMWWGLH